MNDLTFGATLLSCFATLIIALALEATAAGKAGSVSVARATPAAVQGVKGVVKDCTTVALATAPVR
jgi:hypothetical protein